MPALCRSATPSTGENLKETTKINPANWRIRTPLGLLLRRGFADLMRAEGYAASARTDEGEHLGYFG